MTTPTPAAAPPDFPITWPNPADQELFWVLDDSDNLHQQLPLDFWLRQQAMAAGGNKANAGYGLPFKAAHRLLNSYVYTSHTPTDLSYDSLLPLLQAAEGQMRAILPDLEQLWQESWLPEIQTHLAFWDSFDLTAADPPDLLAHLAESQQRLERLWELHFTLLSPVGLALSMFDDLVQDMLPQATPFAAYDMLAGFENKTVAGDRQLWQLSRQALTMSGVHQILSSTPPAEVPAKLAESPEGQAFWQTVKAYLQQYGRRNESTRLQDPTWLEDPTPVIEHLQTYLTQPSEKSHDQSSNIAARREAKIAQLRQQLEGYPGLMQQEFEELLAAAQISNVLREDHSYWIDYKTVYYVRQICLEFGRRLQQMGLIDERDDVFYLTVADLQQLAAPPTADFYRSRVNTYKTQLTRFADCTPPPVLGVLPSTPPPHQFEDALSRANLKFSGGMPPPGEDAPTNNKIQGLPGSGGKATGPARVLLSLADANKLMPGDILVAQATLPSWTPLFATAAAIVTDRGGVLSHTAVVAREYNLPAVVGTQNATTVIQDGQLLEVDGDSGTIRLI